MALLESKLTIEINKGGLINSNLKDSVFQTDRKKLHFQSSNIEKKTNQRPLSSGKKLFCRNIFDRFSQKNIDIISEISTISLKFYKKNFNEISNEKLISFEILVNFKRTKMKFFWRLVYIYKLKWAEFSSPSSQKILAKSSLCQQVSYFRHRLRINMKNTNQYKNRIASQ